MPTSTAVMKKTAASVRRTPAPDPKAPAERIAGFAEERAALIRERAEIERVPPTLAEVEASIGIQVDALAQRSLPIAKGSKFDPLPDAVFRELRPRDVVSLLSRLFGDEMKHAALEDIKRQRGDAKGISNPARKRELAAIDLARLALEFDCEDTIRTADLPELRDPLALPAIVLASDAEIEARSVNDAPDAHALAAMARRLDAISDRAELVRVQHESVTDRLREARVERTTENARYHNALEGWTERGKRTVLTYGARSVENVVEPREPKPSGGKLEALDSRLSDLEQSAAKLREQRHNASALAHTCAAYLESLGGRRVPEFRFEGPLGQDMSANTAAN